MTDEKVSIGANMRNNSACLAFLCVCVCHGDFITPLDIVVRAAGLRGEVGVLLQLNSVADTYHL